MKNVILVLLLLSCVSCAPAYADETYLYAGAWSHHLSSGDYNETHNLVAIKHGSWMGGYFKNSHKRDTGFIVYDYDVNWFDSWDTGVYLGAMRGYTTCIGEDDSNTDTCPLLAPYGFYNKNRFQPGFIIMGDAPSLSFRYLF